VGPFGCEELEGSGLKVALVGAVLEITPGAQLLVAIGQALKAATGVEIVFDEVKGALHAARAVGIAQLVGEKRKAEAGAKRLHLRGGDGGFARAVGHDDARVIEHAARSAASQDLERFGQKDLGVEAMEGRKDLGIEHAGVAKNERGALELSGRAGNLHGVGRGIVLHLLAGREMVLSGAFFGGAPDALAAQKARERGVRDRDAGVSELLVDAHAVATAAEKELPHELEVGLERKRPSRGAARRLRERPLDRVPGDPERPGNGLHPVALLAKALDRGLGIGIDHGGAP